MVKYRCFRCNYTANHKTSMYNHYARSVKCSKNIDSLKFDENQIVKYSFTEIDDHKRLDNINYNNYCVEKNSEEFINEIKNVYKEKQRSCSYCNKIFAKYKDLEYHLFECIYITNKITLFSDDIFDTNFEQNMINNNIQQYSLKKYFMNTLDIYSDNVSLVMSAVHSEIIDDTLHKYIEL